MTNQASEDELYYVFDEALVALFYEAFEAGGDIVLERQFENDPGYKARYAQRCIKEARNKSADLWKQYHQNQLRKVLTDLKKRATQHCAFKIDQYGSELDTNDVRLAVTVKNIDKAIEQIGANNE